MAKVELRILTRDDVERLMPPMADIMEVIETGLAAHGTGDVVLPPKAHIHLDKRYNGHFNVLPGSIAFRREVSRVGTAFLN